MREGYAIFFLQGISMDYLQNCKYQISFLDVTNHKVSGIIQAQAASAAGTTSTSPSIIETVPEQ
jgi:hypothetical protein